MMYSGAYYLYVVTGLHPHFTKLDAAHLSVDTEVIADVRSDTTSLYVTSLHFTLNAGKPQL